jgi:hypothetical protein
MRTVNVTKTLLRVNTLAFVGLAVFLIKGKGTAPRMQRRLAMAVAASVALQYLLPLVMDAAGMLGGVRVDASSNKLMVEWDFDRQTKDPYFRSKYSDPESFQDYVFVYDPSDVHFDSYSANYTRRSRKLNGPRRSDKGEVFPGDPSLRMISIPEAAGAPRTYRQPSGSKDPGFVSSITAQFFYQSAGKSVAENAEKLAKFQRIETKGRFLIKTNGMFEEVPRLAGSIRL